MRLFMFCLLLSAALPALAGGWRVVGDEQFTPYSFQYGEDPQPRGLDVEVVQAVLREAGIEYQLRLYPWARVKQMLALGDAEMAFQFTGTPERKAQYELVGPLRSGATVFMTTRMLPLDDWRRLDDLRPYVVGQVSGYAYEAAFDSFELVRDSSAQNPRQLVAMLLASRIDIIVGDRLQLMHFVREQRAEQQVRILPRPLVEMPRYVAFAKGDSARAQRFASALQRLQRAGKLDAIYRRWGL